MSQGLQVTSVNNVTAFFTEYPILGFVLFGMVVVGIGAIILRSVDPNEGRKDD